MESGFECDGKLEFLRTNDREQEIHDQEKRNDSYNDVGHGMLCFEG